MSGFRLSAPHLCPAGSRAPPGQNMRMPYAGFRWLGVAHELRVPTPWSAPARCLQVLSRLRRAFRFSGPNLNVSAVQPILAAIDWIATHSKPYSPWCSLTIRTARPRTSGKNCFVIFVFIAPSSHKLKPPKNPGRFSLKQTRPV